MSDNTSIKVLWTSVIILFIVVVFCVFAILDLKKQNMELKAYVANYSRTVDYLDSDVADLEFRIDDMDSRIEALEY